MTTPKRFLNSREAAEEFGWPTVKALQTAVTRPNGPPHMKIGKNLRFDRLEMEAWMAAQRRQTA